MKRKLIRVTPAVLLAFFLVAGAAQSKVYVIDNTGDKVPTAVEKPDAKMADVPEINGQKNKGFGYGTYDITVGPVKINKITVVPKGTIVTHEAPSTYLCIIVKGEGQLGLVDKAGKTVSTVHYKAGDFILFQPNTLHNWKNGNKATEMLGIEYAAPAAQPSK